MAALDPSTAPESIIWHRECCILGQKLAVTLSNQGNELHNFTVGAQHIDENVQAGTPVNVTVTFPAAGAVTFVCRFHLIQNMRGELVVGAGP